MTFLKHRICNPQDKVVTELTWDGKGISEVLKRQSNQMTQAKKKKNNRKVRILIHTISGHA